MRSGIRLAQGLNEIVEGQVVVIVFRAVMRPGLTFVVRSGAE